MTDQPIDLPHEEQAPDSSAPTAAPQAWKAPELREIALSDTAGDIPDGSPAEGDFYGPFS